MCLSHPISLIFILHGKEPGNCVSVSRENLCNLPVLLIAITQMGPQTEKKKDIFISPEKTNVEQPVVIKAERGSLSMNPTWNTWQLGYTMPSLRGLGLLVGFRYNDALLCSGWCIFSRNGDTPISSSHTCDLLFHEASHPA